MLNNQGIFVVDFSIAKMLKSDNAESLQLSMTGGVLIGTPYYMSPEQCLGNQVEARSDLYSLGALLFEMISGRPPFDEDVFSAIFIKHAMIEAPKLEDFAPEIPLALASVVNQLIAKKLEDRPLNADATKELLKAGLINQTIPAANSVTQNFTAPVNPTRNLNSATNAQISPPNIESKNAPVNKEQRNIGLLAAIGGFVALAAVLLLGGLWYAKSLPNATMQGNNAANQTETKSMSNMPMGDDFAKKEQPNDGKINSATVPLLSAEEADKVITRITQTTEHRADGMQIIKTPKDSALVCIHNMIEMGKTHMFAVERPNVNSVWEITARISLDTPDFHGANWTFEPQDVDGDGFEEVIFHGANADNTSRKVLIYVPRTRQNY